MRTSWPLVALWFGASQSCGGRTNLADLADLASETTPRTDSSLAGAPGRENVPNSSSASGASGSGGAPSGGAPSGELASGGAPSGGVASGGTPSAGGQVGVTGGKSSGGAGGLPGAGRGGAGGDLGAGGQGSAAGELSGSGAAAGVSGEGGAGGEACLPETLELVVDRALPHDTRVPSLLRREDELILLALTNAEAGARLYRHDLDGEQLGVVHLPGGRHSQLLATETGFLLLHAGAGQLELRQLSAAGDLVAETFVDLDVGPSSDVWVAAAVGEDRLAVAYLLGSGELIGNHGVVHFATFSRDGSQRTDVPLATGDAIVEPRSVVPTAAGWAVAWAEIASGDRRVHLHELEPDGLTIASEARVATFRQDLQGGFPSLPLVAAGDGSLVLSWLDTRDDFEEPDLLVVWRRDPSGREELSSHPVETRLYDAPDLAEQDGDIAVLVTVDDHAEVRHVVDGKPGPVEAYDAPDVTDHFDAIERLPGGYALAGARVATSVGATVELVLHRCAER
ncbi:MAG: hypothetical protein JW751_06930 [Polyangiaceae bacterium]|nr:hypothetical protein [Polyangiaceae bacterium]